MNNKFLFRGGGLHSPRTPDIAVRPPVRVRVRVMVRLRVRVRIAPLGGSVAPFDAGGGRGGRAPIDAGGGRGGRATRGIRRSLLLG